MFSLFALLGGGMDIPRIRVNTDMDVLPGRKLWETSDVHLPHLVFAQAPRINSRRGKRDVLGALRALLNDGNGISEGKLELFSECFGILMVQSMTRYRGNCI